MHSNNKNINQNLIQCFKLFNSADAILLINYIMFIIVRFWISKCLIFLKDKLVLY